MTGRAMRSVAFRVDVSRRIGGGHLMRCLALAEAMKARGYRSTFLSRALDGAQPERVEDAGHVAITLDAPAAPPRLEPHDPPHAAWLEVDWRADAEECLEALASAPRFDWLVVDHYALDHRWIDAVAPVATRVLVIDDVDDRDLSGDVLLNQSLLKGAPRRTAPAHKLVGPRYALLRPEFAALRPASLARRAAAARISGTPRILVSTGLMDVGGAALRASEALAGLDLLVDVALSSRAASAKALQALQSLSASNIRLHLDSTEIGALMRDADLAIGAAGSTTWERLAMGVPSLVYTLAENQKEIAAALGATGAAVLLGRPETQSADALRDMVAGLLRQPNRLAEMSRRAAELCDGRGAERVATVLATS